MKFDIQISKDEMKATITLIPDSSEDKSDLSFEDIKEALTAQGVIEGIKPEVIQHICSQKKFNQQYLIASGKKPEVGEDAKLKILTKQRERSSYDKGVDADKKVNHYGIREGFLNFVKEKDIIAQRIPPKIGKSGITVTGKEIEGIRGKDINLEAFKGLNTKVESNRVIATKSGILKREDSKFVVQQNIVLENDLGLKTGSIILPLDVDVELTVPGDIKRGFTVQCNKIVVLGNVEDAKVTARTLDVKRGIVGKSDIPIIADNLFADFIIGSRKIKAKFVDIKKEITGGSTILANFVRANTVQECTIKARYGVWADYLYGKNDIFVGIDVDENEEFIKWKAQFENVSKAIKELQQKNIKLIKKEKKLREMVKNRPDNPILKKELEKVDEVLEKIKKFEKIKNALKDKLNLHYENMYISGSPFILIKFGLSKKKGLDSSAKQFNKLNIKEFSYSSHKMQIPGLYTLKGEEVVVNRDYNINEINKLIENYKSGK